MNAKDSDIFNMLADARKAKQASALCVVVRTSGSTPRKSGAKMVVYSDGTISGTIGGGELEKRVIENALNAIKENKIQWFRHDLLHHHNMCCGGTVEVYIEPLMKPKKLYIFGAGHVGQALAKYATGFGFDIYLVDDRKEYLDQCDIESVSKMNLPFDQALQLLPFDMQTYICIMTYDHATDREILSFCMKKEHAYLGMIGSQRKVEVTKKIFLEAGFCTKEELDAVDMPIGFEINADGPLEIAISILARLLEAKNSKTHPPTHSLSNREGESAESINNNQQKIIK
ncbi:MAG: XdhC family protein [Bacteroidia bacterium]